MEYLNYWNIAYVYLVIGAAWGTQVALFGDYRVKGFASWIPEWTVVVAATALLWLPALLHNDGEISWWKRK